MDDRARTKSDGGPPVTSMVARIAAMQDYERYRDLAWDGSFEEYLGIIRERPQVTRNAFQRVYDMVISYGTEEYIDNKKKLTRFNFFKDELNHGANAIYGLDIPLMRLVHVLKAASVVIVRGAVDAFVVVLQERLVSASFPAGPDAKSPC